MLKRFLFLGIVVLLATSCSDFNTLKVKKTNFEEEIQRAQNLVFTFNKDIITDTLLMNRWDTISYIEFKPAIPGRFMWTTKNELTFSPTGILAPATSYKAKLSKNLLLSNKAKFKVSDETIEFHTPITNIENITSFWALNGDLSNTVEIRTQVKFNNTVSPSVLKPLLKLTMEGKAVSYRILTQNPADIIEIAIDYDKNSSDSEAEGFIEIAKGLTCVGGSNATQTEIKKSFIIPSKDKLEVTSLETGFDAGKGYVNVYTSQPVVSEGLKSYIQITPSVDFIVEMIENGFLLKGDFLASQSYNVTIQKGLTSVFNIQLAEDYTSVASFSEPIPTIQFTEQKALYLSTGGSRNLGINIVNVPKVKVSAFKIFENNIQHYLRQGKNWDYYYEDDEYYDYYTWMFDENYGKPVMSKEIQARSLSKIGNISLLNLDLQDLNYSESYKGLYLIKVESTEHKFLQDVQLVSFSDLGLIVKEGSNDVMVFVNSLKDASPLRGVKVDFISSNNQKVFSSTTDGNGVVVFKNARQAAAGFKLSMITARNGEDFNFLLFDNTRVETSRFDAGGKRIENTNYDVFIYGDRNLYRPGDSIHFNTIVRTLKWDVVGSIPIKIKLIAPNGREYLNVRKQLNASGAAATDFYIPVQALTGTYTIEVYSANDVVLASRKISVEEFVPDRIKVNSTLNKNVYLPAEKILVSIEAHNLYGTPAKGKRFEAELRLSRKQLICKLLPDFIFNMDSKNNPVLGNVLKQGTTNEEGKAEVEVSSIPYKNIGLLEGKIYTTVFDETGRPVNRLNVVEIPTQHVFYGIRNFGYWISTHKPINLQFASVDRNGNVLPTSKAKVIILYYSYETVIENSNGRYNYVSQRKEKTMFAKEIVLKGSSTILPFIPSISGEYEVRIMDPESENYVSKRFYAYGWNDTNFSSFEVNREGEVAITADKGSYVTGGKAKLLFKAPFDGQMLVTIEKENVISYKYITLVNKSASLDIDITSDFLPNVYVSATAFRKITDLSIPLTVAHGVVSLKVEDPQTKLPVTIIAVDKSKSGIRQSFTVKTTPGAEVTIAVVDEGILQVTDFKTPDPLNFFYQKRALGVTSFDIYALLFPELRKSSTAGGEAFDLSKRINPLTGERVKLISKWSGLLKANSSGDCSFKVDIPQFSGALRIMAVAYKGKQFGSASKMMTVADPVILSMALPRFLSPGDKCIVAVNLTNTTSTNGVANVQLSTNGSLAVQGAKTKQISLKSKAEEVLLFEINAGSQIGYSKVTATVNALGQKFVQQIDLPIRPASGYSYITGTGSVGSGKSISFKPVSDFIPIGSESMLVVSKSPALELGKSLDYLIRYPHGCLEQTISCAFPQLYLDDIYKLISPDDFNQSEINHNVQQAILKVESRQLYNGGFSMWPEGGQADWWASNYAAHFLIEARNAGFDVNNNVLNAALKYLNQKVKERQTSTYFYYENGIEKKRTVPSQELFYSMYVLAIADQPALSAMNYYKSLLGDLTVESRYLLAASFMLTGDVKTYRTVLPSTFGNELAISAFSGAYSSHIRNLSISVNALLEADPTNPQIGLMLKRVAQEFTHTRYFSTQDAAFALLAIGKQTRRATSSDVKAQLFVEGKQVGSFLKDDLCLKVDIANKNVKIVTSGNGNLYYYYKLSGIKSKPFMGNVDNHLKVRRRFLDRNGAEITSNSFKQNDLVVIELALQAENGEFVDNVAITDILPACFEIENSRLVKERDYDFLKNRSIADYTDIRDDRISFFTQATPQTKLFYYTVRVVSKGVFVIGAVGADAMYNGEYHSYSGAGKVVVQ